MDASELATMLLQAFASNGMPDVLTGAAGGAMNARQRDDYIKLALQGANLSQQKFAESVPQTRLSAARNAAIGKYAKPSATSWGGPGSGLRGEVPTFTGGPSGVVQGMSTDPDFQGLNSSVLADEAAAQKQGGLTGGNQDRQLMPGVKDLGTPGWDEKILGGTGLAAALLRALMGGRGAGSGGGSGGSGGGGNIGDLLNNLLNRGGGGGTPPGPGEDIGGGFGDYPGPTQPGHPDPGYNNPYPWQETDPYGDFPELGIPQEGAGQGDWFDEYDQWS